MDNHVLGKIAAGMGKDLAYLPPAKIAEAYREEWFARYGELLFAVSMQCDAKTIQLVKDLAKFVTPAIAGYTAGVACGMLPGCPVADAAEEGPELFDEMTGPMDESGFGAGAGVGR